MPRANRLFLPGYAWHITHRCHKKEFLLKFARDRNRWVQWLFEARKRYGLSVLNYVVTSNHVHLLVFDTGRNEIPPSMRLIAGRVAQEYNRRKGRKGAFWEDRYHATAVACDDHLVQCLTYIDLNMVRTGVVCNPAQWIHGGYAELLADRQRYRVTDVPTLLRLLRMTHVDDLLELRRAMIDNALQTGAHSKREPIWSSGLAVGEHDFVQGFKTGLQSAGIFREIRGDGATFSLREEEAAYRTAFDTENVSLRTILNQK